MKVKNETLINKRFGRLLVVSVGARVKRHRMLNCLCACGSYKSISKANILNGSTSSCGCWQRQKARESHTTHGRRYTTEYKIWRGIKDRCCKVGSKYYKNYGGRGIKLCERWLSFENFFADMGERPSKKHSIDRIDNDGNYAPDNCRWATHKQQGRNRRGNVLYTYQGKTKTLAAWAEEHNISYAALRNRLKVGWDMQKALTEPIKEHFSPKTARLYSYKGEERSLTDWALKLGIDRDALVYRLKHGWCVDKAFSTPSLKTLRKNQAPPSSK